MNTLRYQERVYYMMNQQAWKVWRRRLLSGRHYHGASMWAGIHRVRGVSNYCLFAMGAADPDVNLWGSLRHVDLPPTDDYLFLEHWDPRELYNEGSLAMLMLRFPDGHVVPGPFPPAPAGR